MSNSEPFGLVRPRRPSGLLPLLVMAGIAGLALGRYGLSALLDQSRAQAAPRPVAARGELLPSERATIELFERVSPSVVYISPMQRRRDFFTLNVMEVPTGTGSGFIWDEEGHVVTNFHVIRGASAARVTLHDRTQYDAELVGTAIDKDIAVLRINAPRHALRPVAVGTSHDLRVGQTVLAIGNPFGLDYTLTVGIISAMNREIQALSGRTIQGVIQTDAAINPGNSGGPLLDSSGRLIGMNTAILSPSGSSAGIGFAVPVDVINRVVPQVIMYGRAIQPGLGITTHPQLEQYARELNIPGVIVLQVAPGSSAARAGLRGIRENENGDLEMGDIILRVGEVPTPNYDALANALERYEIGQTAEVTIRRGRREMTVKVNVQAVE